MVRLLAAALLACLALAAPASAADVDLPQLFAGELPTVKRATRVPVLLPQTLPSDSEGHFPSAFATRRSWGFQIGAVEDCGGANACFVASFEAKRWGRAGPGRRVRLARGRVGYFNPTSCGASCAPPTIEWRERSAIYYIAARVGDMNTERRLLVRMANSAIRSGPR